MDIEIFYPNIKSSVLIDLEDIDSAMHFDGKVTQSGGSLTICKRENYKVIHISLASYIIGKPWSLVDHKNRNPYNNKRSNLRVCNRSQNNSNREKYIRKINNKIITTCNFIGVRFHKGKYEARVSFKNKVYHVGTFDTAEEAAIARDRKALEIQGEFAVLNFHKSNYE